jgi:hypothetical protein
MPSKPLASELKLPDAVIEDLGEAEGVPSAPSNTPGLPKGLDHLELAYAAIGMQRSGGLLAATSMGLAPPVMNANPEAANSQSLMCMS